MPATGRLSVGVRELACTLEVTPVVVYVEVAGVLYVIPRFRLEALLDSIPYEGGEVNASTPAKAG